MPAPAWMRQSAVSRRRPCGSRWPCRSCRQRRSSRRLRRRSRADSALELVDQLHGPDLRARPSACPPESRPARTSAGPAPGRAACRGPPRPGAGRARTSRPSAKRGDLDAPDLADPAEVVAREIHEHDVLGALLGILAKSGPPERRRPRRRAAARHRPGDGTRLDLAAPGSGRASRARSRGCVASRVSR